MKVKEQDKLLLELIWQGMEVKQIVIKMGMPMAMVYRHRRRLLKLANTNSVVSLIRWGLKNKYILI